LLYHNDAEDTNKVIKNKLPDSKRFYLTSATNPRFLFAVTYIYGLGTDRTYVEFDFKYIDPQTNNKWLKVNELVSRSIGPILQVADFNQFIFGSTIDLNITIQFFLFRLAVHLVALLVAVQQQQDVSFPCVFANILHNRNLYLDYINYMDTSVVLFLGSLIGMQYA
jgi:hypothetical protein